MKKGFYERYLSGIVAIHWQFGCEVKKFIYWVWML
jgi:hypothetical protein